MLSVSRVKEYSYIRFPVTHPEHSVKINLVIYMMANTIGKNIKNLRRLNAVKQDVLASSLHLSRQTLSSYERGITLPNIYILIRIADYFNVTLDELTGRTELKISESEYANQSKCKFVQRKKP